MRSKAEKLRRYELRSLLLLFGLIQAVRQARLGLAYTAASSSDASATASFLFRSTLNALSRSKFALRKIFKSSNILPLKVDIHSNPNVHLLTPSLDLIMSTETVPDEDLLAYTPEELEEQRLALPWSSEPGQINYVEPKVVQDASGTSNVSNPSGSGEPTGIKEKIGKI